MMTPKEEEGSGCGLFYSLVLGPYRNEWFFKLISSEIIAFCDALFLSYVAFKYFIQWW
jgi:hypothetical protein